MNMITLPVSTIEKVEKNLKEVLDEVRALKAKIKVKKSAKPLRFWTKEEWERAEREADEDIKAGRVSGPFNSARELIEHLHKEAGI